MYAISAAEAISPAIQRTRALFFQPFRWSTFLKLSLVAWVTGGVSGRRFPSFNSDNHTLDRIPDLHSPFNFAPQLIAMIIAAILVTIVVGLVISYLITRLRFAFFHCLIHNTRQILPGWRLYGAQALRFFWLNLIVGFCFVVVVLGIVLAFGTGIWKLIRNTPAGGHPDVASILTLVLPLIPIILLLALVGFAVQMILLDFMLPHFALDNASAGDAWGAAWDRISIEKGAFFIYALLRVILPILASIAIFIVLFIPGVVFAGSVAASEVAIHAAFADATDGASAVGITLAVGIGAIAVVIGLFVAMCIAGPFSTAIREYSLVFYGGRYQRLGDALYPPAPPAAVSPQAAV